MDKDKIKQTALSGILDNPVFVMVLGMCPTIAQTTNVENAFWLGLATLFVLVVSCVVVSLLRKVIPDKVRMPAFIVIVASLVAVVQMFMKAYLPELDDKLGAFIALIAVNCIIMGQIEGYASKNSVGYSALSSASIGVGFVVALCILGGIRQVLIIAGFELFAKAAGGFIILGLLIALYNVVFELVKRLRASRPQKTARLDYKVNLNLPSKKADNAEVGA